jgi:uncharacterized protein (TIGR03437 family)
MCWLRCRVHRRRVRYLSYALFALLLGAPEARGQGRLQATVPKITAVVNGASFQPGIVSGSWATVIGTGLSNTTRSWMASDFINGALPPQMDYVSVTVNGRPAFIGYISPTQLNVLIPDDGVLGTSTVQAAGQLLQSNIFITNKLAVSPGLFPFTSRYPAAVHLDGTLAGPSNLLPGSVTAPVHPNETIELFGTGFGASNPAIATGQVFSAAAPLTQPMTATIGGVSASVTGYLIAPGLYQFNIAVPNLSDGDAAVSLTVAGETTPVGLFLNIAR